MVMSYGLNDSSLSYFAISCACVEVDAILTLTMVESDNLLLSQGAIGTGALSQHLLIKIGHIGRYSV